MTMILVNRFEKTSTKHSDIVLKIYRPLIVYDLHIHTDIRPLFNSLPHISFFIRTTHKTRNLAYILGANLSAEGQ